MGPRERIVLKQDGVSRAGTRTAGLDPGTDLEGGSGSRARPPSARGRPPSPVDGGSLRRPAGVSAATAIPPLALSRRPGSFPADFPPPRQPGRQPREAPVRPAGHPARRGTGHPPRFVRPEPPARPPPLELPGVRPRPEEGGRASLRGPDGRDEGGRGIGRDETFPPVLSFLKGEKRKWLQTETSARGPWLPPSPSSWPSSQPRRGAPNRSPRDSRRPMN